MTAFRKVCRRLIPKNIRMVIIDFLHFIKQISPPPPQKTHVIHKDHMSDIDRERIELLCTNVRNSELELLSYEINERGIGGSVAELGVHRGDFAKLINLCFPNRKCYLFDTFEGFNDNDIALETKHGFSGAAGAKTFYAVESLDIVMNKMPNPAFCVIKKGWFPDTAKDIEDSFAFVHLDADLYAPIYAGLVYFYPKLSKGGYILVHDYNNKHYRGVMSAVRRYCSEMNISYVPLCDSCGSVVITK